MYCETHPVSYESDVWNFSRCTNVVVAAEEDKKCSGSRRDEDKPVLSKGVGIEQTTALIFVAYRVLLLLISAVQDREVEI